MRCPGCAGGNRHHSPQSPLEKCTFSRETYFQKVGKNLAIAKSITSSVVLLQRHQCCAASTWSNTFFPPDPLATLLITPLTTSVASSSLRFPPILTISCFGSLNYIILSTRSENEDIRRTLPAVKYSISPLVARARSSGPLCLYHSVCQKPCAVRLLNMNTEVGKLSGSLDIAPYVTRWAFFPARRNICVVDFPPMQFNNSRTSYETISRLIHEEPQCLPCHQSTPSLVRRKICLRVDHK